MVFDQRSMSARNSVNAARLCARQAAELFTRHARPLRTKVVALAGSDTCEAQRAQNQAPSTTSVSLPIAEDFFAMLCAENAAWINPRGI